LTLVLRFPRLIWAFCLLAVCVGTGSGALAQGDHRLVVCQGLVAFQSQYPLVRAQFDRLSPPFVHRDIVEHTIYNCPMPNHSVSALIWQHPQGELSLVRLNEVWAPIIERIGGTVMQPFSGYPFQGGVQLPHVSFRSTHAGFETLHEMWLMWLGEGYAALVISCDALQPEVLDSARGPIISTLRFRQVQYQLPPPPRLAERRVANGLLKMALPEAFARKTAAELNALYGTAPNPNRPIELWSADPSNLVSLSVVQPDARTAAELVPAQVLEAYALRKLQMGIGSERLGAVETQTQPGGAATVAKLGLISGGRKLFLVVGAIHTRQGVLLLELQSDYGQRDYWEPVFESCFRSLSIR
jgi:hypothetical protein